MEHWLAITVAVLSLLSLAYSLWLLFQIKTSKPETSTSSTEIVPVRKRHFLLELIALRVPEVQAFLAKGPPQLFLAVRDTGTDPGEHEAILTSSGDAGDKVTIDLTKRSDVEPLVRALMNPREPLAGGSDLWRKKRNRRNRKQPTLSQ